MRASKKSLMASSLIALTTSASAQLSTRCQGSACFSLNIPANTASSGSGDIFFQISAPTTYEYVALGQGKNMGGSNMFVVYTAANGNNVTLSPRTAKGHNTPTLNSNSQVTLLEGSGISGGKMIANVKCSNCASFSGADFTAAKGSWIWGVYTSGGPKNSDDQSASIRQHSNYGSFQWDYTSAKGGNSVNPLLSSTPTGTGSGATGTQSCIPRPASQNAAAAPTATKNEANSDSSDSDDDSGGFGGPLSKFGGWPSGAPTAAPWNGGRFRRQTLPYCDELPNASSPASASPEETRRRNMLIAHGTLAALAFVILFPVGGIAIRLASFPGLLWVHGAFQVFAYIVYIVAFGLGVNIATDLNLMDDSHPIIGIALLAVLFLMPILGYVHHIFFKKTGGRTLWSHAHLWIGRLAISIGIINGGIGFNLAEENGVGSKGGLIAYGIVGAAMWLIWMAASVMGERRRKFSGRQQPPKYTEHSPTSDTALHDLRGHPENGHYAPIGR